MAFVACLQIIAVSVAAAAPATPVVTGTDSGNFWVQHNWQAGTGGDAIDNYFISVNGGEWTEYSETSYTDSALEPHATSTLQVYAYNATTGESATVTSSATLENNAVYITNVVESVTITLGDTVTVDADSTDADNDVPTFSCSRDDLFTDFDSAEGTGSFTPTAATDYYVAFSVADGYGSTATQGMNIYVESADHAPVLNSIGNKEVDAGDRLSFTVSATDEDDDKITYTATGLPDGATLGSNSGDFSWRTSDDDGGSYSVTFTATANGLSDSETIKITVIEEDVAPVLDTIGDKSVGEGATLSFTVSATDDNDDTITYSASGLPGGATLDSSSGAFRWTPAYDTADSYSVTFTATANGLSDSETITITVTHVDRAPVLDSIGNKEVDENTLLTFNISATDPDGDLITYSASNLPEGSTFTPSTGVFSWTPGYNDSGNYDVEFSATANGLRDVETITITVGDYNRPPVLSSIGSQEVDEEEKLRITLSATDPDGDDLIFSVDDAPNGSAFNATTGVFTWTPEEGDAGTYYTMFSVTDGSSTDTENVTITVEEPSSSSSGGSSGGSGSSSGSSDDESSGGGGGVSSGEEYENVLLRDYALKTTILRDVDSIFSFNKPGNCITSASFVSDLNGGQSKIIVEILQDTSSQVDSDAPGDVYRNTNILLDTGLIENAINDREVNFKIEKSWVEENNINTSLMTLCFYTSGEWELLETDFSSEDETYMYYSTEIPDFGFFAISSVDPAELIPEAAPNIVTIPQTEDGLASTADSLEMELGEASQSGKSAFVFVILLLVAGIGIIYWALRL
ncbi:MAG: putative Ig domain-containing protein [Methanolobus sp.]